MHYSCINIKKCSQNNLKNISLTIPKNKLIVIVGISGAGKSSLAFDVIFAEGQRRYMECLSLHSRSQLKQLPKPHVELIEGLSPILAIGQHTQQLSPRSTVASYTDIYNFLALCYVNFGEQYSPYTDKKLNKQTPQQIIETILKEYETNSRIQIIASIPLENETLHDAIERLQKQGFIRLLIDEKEFDPSEGDEIPENAKSLEVVIDRLIMKENIRERLSSSILSALQIGGGVLKIQKGRDGITKYFTEIFVCPESGQRFSPLETTDFNFNSPKGACPRCLGKGGYEEVIPEFIEFDDDIYESANDLLTLFPRKQAAHYQAIWNSYLEQKKPKKDSQIKKDFLYGNSTILTIQVSAGEHKHTIKTPWKGFVALLRHNIEKQQITSMPFIQWKTCEECHGGRLKTQSLYCRLNGKNIHELCSMTVSEALKEIKNWSFDEKIANEIMPPIIDRLSFLEQVGLGYLSLDQQGTALSMGEAHRVQLASNIGAKLSGILYILDEPSTGLHKQDIKHLAKVLKELASLDNTILFVDHDEELISKADHVIELGPGSGIHGGIITFEGNYEELLTDKKSITGSWLSNKKSISLPKRYRKSSEWLEIHNASCHNINNLTVSIPLQSLVGICGVSGSGKSTLAFDILAQELKSHLTNSRKKPPHLSNYQNIAKISLVGQTSGNKNIRSTPATYVNIMEPIRQLFAQTKLAKARGYSPAHFTLNKKGGRCEACEGLGMQRLTMSFLPDAFIVCDVCHGQRYNYETLQITWNDRNFADILNMTAEQALALFKNIPLLAHKLQTLQDLGLEYLQLGQTFNTLSPGEIQRLRLAAEITKKRFEPTLYIFDEPSAGLHMEDIAKLIPVLHKLVDAGHSVIMVEHNLTLLQQADRIIELGPTGGPSGGKLIFEGTPQQLAQSSTPTGALFFNAC